MKQEIERRWVLSGLPKLFCLYRAQVTQGYISAVPEVRLRETKNITECNRDDLKQKPFDNYQLTVKVGSGVSRDEWEINLTAEQFHDLRGVAKNWVKKDFRLFELPENTLVVSIVEGESKSVILAEVEFESLEAADEFDPVAFEDVIVEEVTHNSKYNMKNISETLKSEHVYTVVSSND